MRVRHNIRQYLPHGLIVMGGSNRIYAKQITQLQAGDVETAKAAILTADALANNDTNATQIDYAITDDGNGINKAQNDGVGNKINNNADAQQA